MTKTAIKFVKLSNTMSICAHVQICTTSDNIKLAFTTPIKGIMPNFTRFYGKTYSNITELRSQLLTAEIKPTALQIDDVLISPEALVRELSSIDSVGVDNWIYSKDSTALKVTTNNNILYLHNEQEGWVIRFMDCEWSIKNSVDHLPLERI